MYGPMVLGRPHQHYYVATEPFILKNNGSFRRVLNFLQLVVPELGYRAGCEAGTKRPRTTFSHYSEEEEATAICGSCHRGRLAWGKRSCFWKSASCPCCWVHSHPPEICRRMCYCHSLCHMVPVLQHSLQQHQTPRLSLMKFPPVQQSVRWVVFHFLEQDLSPVTFEVFLLPPSCNHPLLDQFLYTLKLVEGGQKGYVAAPIARHPDSQELHRMAKHLLHTISGRLHQRALRSPLPAPQQLH
mmetsp:Transcript_23961/g.41773  ORF Transcript_23961/g.41773 Transcript_23961/m.41773 type:complete len:242 (+) Transcript_23961:90-815(+)